MQQIDVNSMKQICKNECFVLLLLENMCDARLPDGSSVDF